MTRATAGGASAALTALPVAVLTALALVVVHWAPPRADVPDPAPDAAPAQVVQAYLAAVSARDFDTANKLVLPAWFRHGRLDRAPVYRDLRVGEPRNLKPADPAGGGSSADAFTQAVAVPSSYRLSGGDVPGQDGLTEWTWILARNTDDARWLIIDAGPV
ncbi:MAG: hypothetical protein JNL54_21830 [Kineosporiaceae bacterium]|nr:hypothetical protein [Kineosporiaceae bacterium]